MDKFNSKNGASVSAQKSDKVEKPYCLLDAKTNLNVVKTRSNLTVFIIEYFYSCIDLIKIKYFS